MFRIFNLFLLLIFNFSLKAQSKDSCACCTPQHKAFDFWLGEWSVVDSTGKILGHNTIEKVQDQCMLYENWKGQKGSTGSSFSFYNKQNNTWNQHWIDGQGNVLELSGNAQPGEMKLKSKIKEKNGKKYYDVIRWVLQDNGDVHQIWEQFSEEDQKLGLIFFGIYQEK